MKQNCCPVCKITGLLVVVGALNWGLIGFFDLNAVAHFLGEATMATRVVYGVIGVAGLIKLVSCFKTCPCSKKPE